MCIITGAGACIQTKQLMPAVSMSNANLSYRNCGCCVHERIFLLLFAVLWAFSVRFGYIMAPVPFAEVLTASFVLAEGRKQLRDQPSLVGELRRQSVIILVQVMLCIVYPVSIYDSTQTRRPRSSTANDQIWNAKRCSLVDQPFGGVHAWRHTVLSRSAQCVVPVKVYAKCELESHLLNHHDSRSAKNVA